MDREACDTRPHHDQAYDCDNASPTPQGTIESFPTIEIQIPTPTKPTQPPSMPGHDYQTNNVCEGDANIQLARDSISSITRDSSSPDAALENDRMSHELETTREEHNHLSRYTIAVPSDSLSTSPGNPEIPSPPASVSVPILTPVSTETILETPPLYKRRERSPDKALGSSRSTDSGVLASGFHAHSITPPPDALPIHSVQNHHPKRLSALDLQILKQAMLEPQSPLSKDVESAIEPRLSSRLGEIPAHGFDGATTFHTRAHLPRRALRNMSSPPISRRKQSPPPRRASNASYTTRDISGRDRHRIAALQLPPLDLRDSETVKFPHRPRSAVINPTAFIIPETAKIKDRDENHELDIPRLPLPPMSFPAHLELELTAAKPSSVYIYRPSTCDEPYESMAVKFDRLKNMLLLPPYLERTLIFGVLACLDAWLYTFTILPMRFVAALWVLVQWWAYVVVRETRWIVGFVWYGLGRLWKRARRSKEDREKDREREKEREREESLHGGIRSRRGVGSSTTEPPFNPAHSNLLHRISHLNNRRPRATHAAFRHRRTKSVPSALSSFHKADLLQGAVVLFSCIAMMNMDGSRMYHFIRGQSDIKLYVIFNILEVGDKLLSAVGQDILECLFSSETLSRNAQGRSKVLMPLGMFFLALFYTVAHAVTLYFHTITLNVAVNSYSNALLTLLMSNQFVEVKSTVFKRFEKDNLFQLTCADIVERFQLLVMLGIIGLRNVVEMGGLSVPSGGSGGDAMPIHSKSILPHAFTVLPSWLLSGEVLSPFLIVVASEVFVDGVKHAYVGRFNSIKPGFYSRILDILCKDYYTDAFVTPSLTRRVGLATIPLSCLFIRASIQTYHMFLSTHLAPPLPASTQTALRQESATPSPAIVEAFNKFDTLIRDSLGRSVHGDYNGERVDIERDLDRGWFAWSSDDAIALLTMLVVFFIVFLVALILKLLLGMALLHCSRSRYAKMLAHDEATKRGDRKHDDWDVGSKRVGGFGMVEVTEDKKRWVNRDPTEGAKRGKGTKGDFMGVSRYEMIAKRIW